MFNKTSSAFFQKLLKEREKENTIVKYGYGEQEPGPFFGSFSEALCFIVLFICVCIIIYGLKYVNGDFRRSKKASENPTLPNKPFEAEIAKEQMREQKIFLA
jgi:hypothetical protein